jgi:hypothetical protein
MSSFESVERKDHDDREAGSVRVSSARHAEWASALFVDA